MLKFLKGCDFQDTEEGVISSASPVRDKTFNIPDSDSDLFDKLKKTAGQNTIELTKDGDIISLKCTISTQKKFELKLTYNANISKLPINVDKEGKITILSYAKTSDIKTLIDNKAYLCIDIQINDVNIDPMDLKNILESFYKERLSPSPSTSSSSLTPMPRTLDEVVYQFKMNNLSLIFKVLSIIFLFSFNLSAKEVNSDFEIWVNDLKKQLKIKIMNKILLMKYFLIFIILKNI